MPIKKAVFVDPMECLPVEALPKGPQWTYELKLDGYRMLLLKSGGKVRLHSRRGNDLTGRFQHVADDFAFLPDETVIDGELVALDDRGAPSFNLLQNYRSADAHVMLYAFDILVRSGEDLMKRPLAERREILSSTVGSHPHAAVSQVTLQPDEMLSFVKAHNLEGVIAKRVDSIYEPGLRSGLWVKHRLNRSQDFVIGGYVPSHLGVDSIVIGVYRGKELHYSARVRAGFVPLIRRQVFEKIKSLQIAKCPFVNLPEKNAGRWGQSLIAEKMKECVWIKPRIVAEIEFLEWTGADHLRHTKFVRLRDDREPREVMRED
jgi:bifunctional non-homologous end joining protein LigD